jgi:DENN (AEX-3) domain
VFRLAPGPGTETAAYGKRPLPQERSIPAADENVALQSPKKKRKIEMAQDMRLGALIIPLSNLPLEKALGRKGAARVEQWYQLDSTSTHLVPVQNPPRRGLSTASKLAARRNPSVLLEISFSAPEVLDDSEDELEIDGEDLHEGHGEHGTIQEEDSSDPTVSFSRRASMDMKKLQKAGTHVGEKPQDEKKKFDEDPALAPGVCDFIAVVGAINIGDQSQDNGAKGWVNSNPECAILEQFPSSDEFHMKHGRSATLQNKSEWFCFPEGCRLWRGAEPPSHMDLNLKRFSASSPGGAASSIAAFDACLNCTTSFSWFVIQSNEKENDFKNTKTYGAVIKFYAPAPAGIDSTQDDFAQGMRTSSDLHQGKRKTSQSKRLWVPLGILLTSNLPIVGTMEAMLLRLCEALASKTGGSLHSTSHKRIQQIIHQDLANLIVNFQKPIPGVLHCSIPFLTGERLHLTVPPPTGLPPLPHGASVTSVCRLLGSEGLNVLLAAALTECKILIHSDEIANLPMVAEVATALIYPFVWALPFLPVLPEAMLEFVEAPLSYFIGIPSCKMCEIDDEVLSEIVVIDLDNGFTSPDYYDGR